MAAPNDIAHWRAQIFARLLLAILVLGLATAVPSALLAASEGMWAIVVCDVVALGWIATIWRCTGLSYRSRVLNFLAVAYLVGVVLLLKIGPVSQIYLMAIPLLAALLLGLRPALWSLAAAALAVMLLGYEANGRLHFDGVPDYALLKSAIVTLNFLFIGAVLTLSCAVLLQHLARSLEQLRASTLSLEQGQARLQTLNAELRLTSAAVARLNDMVLIAEIDAAGGSGSDSDSDSGQRIIFVNQAFERRNGYRRDEVLGRGLRLLRGPGTEAETLARIGAAVARNEAVRAELLNYTKAGEAYWVETELVPFADEGGNNTHWVAVERDITERKRSEDDIHRLAFYDVLTGLPNRRLLMDRLDKLLASSQRGGSVSAVMFIDLDHFKYINDARGHATGDALLRNTAARLGGLMRKADTVARIGGDEFVVLLAHLAPDVAGASHAALLVAEKIRRAIADCVEIEGQSYQSSGSIGVTLLPQRGQTAQDLLREADTAMYRAKADGRNGIAFFEEAMQADVEQRLSMERDLAAALAGAELSMHLQPQVDRDGALVGAELLMRWRRADGAMVAPAVFIPVAEECGLIRQLGLWALQQACAAVLRLQAAGRPLPLSVNVSPSQFRQDDFVAQVRRTLAASGAPAALLILEVTEGLLIEKLDETIARMHELAAMGLRFSIDDFGTGYSSLAYLKKMPLYELKIDRSFVRDTPDDASDKAIVQAILAMARHLGLRVVAEGVETQAQADFLTANGCACLQGYLYGRAMPLEALLARLADGPARAERAA
ncbi:diguanylate cyclase [Janthinobacterium sp. BJB412]|nr:diguanylate cyclase [Janthinobacterium sp. BJB412]